MHAMIRNRHVHAHDAHAPRAAANAREHASRQVSGVCRTFRSPGTGEQARRHNSDGGIFFSF
jgi:hypothetical protein